MCTARIKILKSVCSLYILLYTTIIGSLLTIIRDFVWNFCRAHQLELPTLTWFATEFCYSATGFSPYCTYIEIMLIFVSFIWIPLIISSVNTKSCILTLICGFLAQTFLGILLALMMVIPLGNAWKLELLNPKESPSPVAVFIHYITFISLIYLGITLIKYMLINMQNKS